MIVKGILILTMFLNLLIGFFILSQNPNNRSHMLFFLLCFLSAVWTFANFMTTISTSYYWLAATYAMGSLVIFTGLVWTYRITNKIVSTQRIILIFFLTLFFSLYSFIPGFIVNQAHEIQLGAIFKGDVGWGLPLYSVFYILVSFLILRNLHNGIKFARNYQEKRQIIIIFVGALMAITTTALSSFILPYFSFFLFGGVDCVGFLVFLALISYSIFKYELFSIKLIVIELLVVFLWIFIILRIVFLSGIYEVLLGVGILLVAIILGILLIQNVIRGIEQRKVIEDLTHNLDT